MSEIYKISIALTGEQISLLRAAVDAGEYATTSEIIREAVREWQRKRQLQAAAGKRRPRSKGKIRQARSSKSKPNLVARRARLKGRRHKKNRRP